MLLFAIEYNRRTMHPLDNVIWQALTTRDAAFAECHGCARRFPREVTGLGAFRDSNDE